MRKQDFIDALQKAGWVSINDAQWTEIEKLWRELWPVIAELEDDLEDAELIISEYAEGQVGI
jgi:hypothetical protein